MSKAKIAIFIVVIVAVFACVRRFMGQQSLMSQVTGVPVGGAPNNFLHSGRKASGDGVWAYSGETGPAMWSALRSEYQSCGSGKEQSPVDIPRMAKLLAHGLQIRYATDDARVMNTGHGVQVSLGGKSNILWNGHEYDLVDFSVHSPSEHSLDGFLFPMEIQFTHSNAFGKLAMISVFVEKGNANAELEKVVHVLGPELKGDGVSVGRLDMLRILPANADFWSYKGSMTKPPCTENVIWNVFSKTLEMSEEQIAAFRALYASNARPIQPLGERTFLGSAKISVDHH